jgi:hypothetical protein
MAGGDRGARIVSGTFACLKNQRAVMMGDFDWPSSSVGRDGIEMGRRPCGDEVPVATQPPPLFVRRKDLTSSSGATLTEAKVFPAREKHLGDNQAARASSA